MNDVSPTASARRGFFRKDQAWYATSEQAPCFWIGLYVTGGGSDGEFIISQTLGLRLEVYAEAWAVLCRDFADLLAFLAETGADLTADDLQAWMIGAGIEDMTEYSDPGEVQP